MNLLSPFLKHSVYQMGVHWRHLVNTTDRSLRRGGSATRSVATVAVATSLQTIGIHNKMGQTARFYAVSH